MTMTLFSCILGSGSSLPVPAEGDESEVGGESRALGWDDSSVISGEAEEKMGLVTLTYSHEPSRPQVIVMFLIK